MFSLLRKWRHPGQTPTLITPGRWEGLEASLPALDMLQVEEKVRLRALALEFLATKEVCGGGDFEPTEDVRLAVALTACLPILNLGLAWYEGWIEVILYPGDFYVPRHFTDESGVLHEFDDLVAGEAWQGGPVILSWSAEPDPGINPILHEFAHKIDMRSGGMANGCPPLHRDMDQGNWSQAFNRALGDFRQRVCHAERTGIEMLLDPYGAESPAEFFAVMSEAFFETPLLLQEEYPEIYRQLSRLYRQDPAPREAALSGD